MVKKKNKSLRYFEIVLKFECLVLIIILLSSFVFAGDVVVENGRIDVDSKLFIDSSGNVGIGTTSPARKLDVQGTTPIRLGASTSDYVELLQTASNQWTWKGVAGNNILTLDQSAGSIGIGNVNPAQKLEIGNGNIILHRIPTDGSFYIGLGGSDGTIVPSVSGGSQIEFEDSVAGSIDIQRIHFLTHKSGVSYARRMTIDELGNVGIGTSSPANKLHVKDANANAIVEIDSGDGTTERFSSVDLYNNGVAQWGLGKGNTGNFYIDQSGVGNVLTVLKTNRNVGIGISNPAQKLDVSGQIHASGDICTDAGGGKCLSTGGGGSGLPAGTSGQTLRHDGTNWVASSLLLNDGNNIEVQKSGEIYLNVKNTEPSGRQYALVSAGSAGAIGVGKFSIYDKTAGISRLAIDAGGNVGIGTSNPQATLDINGIIRLAKQTGEPVSCTAAQDGAIALTGVYTTCVCKSGTGWVQTTDGVTSCTWSFTGWYSGISYLSDDGANYGSCVQPTEATMNDESTAGKGTYGSVSSSIAWIRVDLGSVKSVNRIRVGGSGPSICWGAAATYWNSNAANIQIQVSSDGSSWTTVAFGNAITYSDSAMSNINFPTASARYVRIYLPSGWLATGQFRIGQF